MRQYNAVSHDVSTTICAKPNGGWNVESTPILVEPPVLAWGGPRQAGAVEVADPITVSEGRTYTHEGTNNFRLHNVVYRDEVTSFKASHFTRAKDGAPSPVAHPLSADVDRGDQDAVVHVPGARRGRVRRLTPVENCRLMDWPDTWLDVPDAKGRMPSDTQKYQMAGNGVASNVAEWLARRIAHCWNHGA